MNMNITNWGKFIIYSKNLAVYLDAFFLEVEWEVSGSEG